LICNNEISDCVNSNCPIAITNSIILPEATAVITYIVHIS